MEPVYNGCYREVTPIKVEPVYNGTGLCGCYDKYLYYVLCNWLMFELIQEWVEL